MARAGTKRKRRRAANSATPLLPFVAEDDQTIDGECVSLAAGQVRESGPVFDADPNFDGDPVRATGPVPTTGPVRATGPVHPSGQIAATKSAAKPIDRPASTPLQHSRPGFGPNPLDPYQSDDHPLHRPAEFIGSTDSTTPSRSVLRKKVLELCPKVPGVYGMFDRQGELIYVGKSRALRHRLMSYFNDSAADAKAGRIVESTRAIVWETQPSDFAAQLRELDLIRRHTPRFNVQGVPDRQVAVYLCLGRKPAETFFIARDVPTKDVVAAEGPFYGAARMRRVVECLNKTFGLRDCSQQTVFQFADQLSLFDEGLRAGCLRLEIGTCLGPCAAACSRDEYLTRVNAAESFLDGFNDEPLVATSDLMQSAADNRQYELAARARDTLASLEYAQRKLSHLGDARRSYSFVYAVPGYDGRCIWYLIRRGEIVDVAIAPAGAEEYQRAKPTFMRWQSKLKERFGRLSGDFPYTVGIVAAWFRKHKGELKRTFAPQSAGHHYHRLPRHVAS